MFTQPNYTNLKWNKVNFFAVMTRIWQVLMILVVLTSLFGMNPNPVLADSPAGTLEDFETGFAGSPVGAHADWYDGGAGPLAATGTGVAGSVGLAQDNDIFTWTAHPFQWSDPTLTGVLIGMDFQTNSSGVFDDDRVGWMISDSSLNSDDIFGVQLDPGGSGQNIEAYWDGDVFGDDDGRTSIVSWSGALTPSAWYRLRMEVTKLTATSARIDVTLTALDGSGNPGAVVASGSIPDTDLLDEFSTTDARPNPGYFPDGASIWPAFKNHNGIPGYADNAYFEILTSTPACYTLTLDHSGNGTTPTASPSTAGCPANEYASGETISLSGATPDSGWQIDGWYGTDNNTSTTNVNTITMPASSHTAGVNYVESEPTCYALTLNHIGNGATPIASPLNSTGCPANEYILGQSISLSGASADSGWEIDGWYGTNNDSSIADTNTVTMPASAHAAGVNYVESVPVSMICEDFDSGWSDGAYIDNADWYSNNGPTIEQGEGVATSWGIGPSGNIFIWKSETFSWTDSSLESATFQLDFETDGSAQFDDDRVGWQTTEDNVSSNNILGVQLDNSGSHLRIEGYWDHVYGSGDDDGRPEIVSLDGLLAANTWYRLKAVFTRLTATSAQIDVELWSLDAGGNPVSLTASGSIADTSALGATSPNASPAPEYFTTAMLYPAYKNHTGAAANADNACYEVITGTPPVQYTLTVTEDDHGSVTLNPAGGIYDQGSTVTLTAVPDSGYLFDSWSGDLTGANNPETLLMDSNKTVTATYVEDTTPPQELPILEGDAWRYFKGTAEPGSGWDDIIFDDSSWLIGPSGFGYGDSDDATVLSDMQNNYVSVYIRKEFTVADAGAVSGLQLSMDYDDSFVAYLNGTQIARNNVTGTPPAYDTIADGNHEASAGTSGLPVEYFTVDPAVLVTGTNVLAIQGHNYQVTSSDFSLIPGLMETTPPPQYTLTAGNDGNGSVTLDPAGGIYDEDTVVTLTPVANSGFGFDSWSGPDASDVSSNGDGTWSITLTGDKEVTANFVELAPLPTGICEDFEDGFTLGAVIGTHAEWFDSGTGPVVTSGEGLAGSIGLAPGSSLFTWTQHPFDWNDPAFVSIKFNMDFRSNESGYFDDDRIGWMITDADATSANFFGIQLDTVVGGDGGIVTYWRDSSDTRIQTPIVPLDALSANTWYRLEATITKLTDTSARIDVSLVELNASGDPTGTSYSGTVDDTSAWPDGVPDLSYFTAATMWPAYKNYNAIPGAADNACFDLVSGRFAFIVSTDWHTSDTYPNSDITAKVAQIANWVTTPPTGMPAPEFMVITGDYPHLWQTQEIIDNELGSDYLWYPVIGNHEISDNQGTAYENFFAVRDTLVPTLPNIVNYGPTGSMNTTYSFDYENAHFVVINPFWDGASDDHTSGGDIPPALNTWVDDDLTAHDATHEFVFIHTPAYPDTRHVGEDLDANPVNRDAFVATLNAHNVETLFAGHTHYYEHDVAPEYPLGTLDQVTNGSLRSGGVPVTVTYVVVEGSTTTYYVYSWTGSAFTLYDQWTIGGAEPPLTCYALTLAYTGNGTTPTASPENSTGCALGEYLAGEPISLSGAVPGSGWQIESWTGTDNNASSASSNTVTMPASAHTAGVNYILSGPTTLICDSFNTYATTGSTIGTYSGWFDAGTGPIVTEGYGVAGTIGVDTASSIFTWTAHPFDWNAVDFAGINLQADFQTDSSGTFDDDRVGWMITDSSVGSDNIFGVQLDPGGSGNNIEAYWDGDTFGDDGGRTSIADLPALSPNAWYRLRAEITKLTATSAQINATLTALDSSGNPGAIVASGTIADTALLPGTTGNEIPNPAYFTGPIWPAFKNYNAITGAFDNACYEIVTGEPPEQFTLTVNIVGNGSVSPNPAGGIYYDGTTVQLTATPDIGYAFDGWTGDLTGITNPESLLIDSDKTVTATFVEVPPVALTVNTVGQGSVSVDPSDDLYPVGTVVNLTATPSSGWYFGGWSGDLNSMANPAPITMDVAKSVTATFTQVPAADYFVDNTVACSDSGAGTLAQPFCTISRAADLVVAGETVYVLNGTYAETVFVANNGTAGNPITFHALPGVTVTGNTGFGAGFGLGGKSYIVIDGFNIYHTLYKGIYVDASDHITISNNHVSYAGADTGPDTHQQGIFVRSTTNSLITGNITDHNSCIGIRLIGGSDYNTVSNNISFANSSLIAYPVVAVSDAAGIELTSSNHNTVINNITYGNEDSGINLYVHPSSGDPSSYNLVVGNLSYSNGDHGIDNNDSPNNTLIGNTVHGNGTVGINFEGDNGSYNAVVYNNISVGNGLTPPNGSFGGNLRVDSQSISGTVLDYNLFNKESASVQIIWNDSSYTSLADFHLVEAGQEVHGLEGDPLFVAPVASVLRTTGVDYPGSETTGDYHLNSGSPAIDSAFSDAPSQPLYDIEGNGRVDDPATSNTGAGARTFDDRGAYEFQPVMDLAYALTLVQDGTTLSGTLDNLTATFPDTIPQLVVDEPYQINSRMSLSSALPAGSKITIVRDGVPEVSDLDLTGIGPFWYTDLLGLPLSVSAPFDANYGGASEHYVITISGNTAPIDTELTIESIISRDLFVGEEVVLDTITLHIVQEADIITHSIPLEVGWNLISFNVHPENTAITTVLSSIAGNYDLIYAWDATGAHSTSGNWMKYAPPPAPPYANTLTQLDETMGFWIRMTTADTLEVTGTAPVTTEITLSTNAGGWNLVSYPSIANLSLPGALSDNGVGTDFSLIYAYHADDPTDPWKLFNRTGVPYANDLTQLTAGWGYWIKVTENHTWNIPYSP